VQDRVRDDRRRSGCWSSDGADFDKLHGRAHDHEAILTVFDLLEFDGEDWRERPLESRKKQLDRLDPLDLRPGPGAGKPARISASFSFLDWRARPVAFSAFCRNSSALACPPRPLFFGPFWTKTR
jgi:hypothetical protein